MPLRAPKHAAEEPVINIESMPPAPFAAAGGQVDFPHRQATGPDAAPLSIGIAGLGNIGADVARWLAGGAQPGLRLAAGAGRDPAAVAALLAAIGASDARATPLDALIDHCDVLVDCLAPDASAELLARVAGSGKTIVPVSVCVLLLHPELVERAREAGTRLLVPSGAVAGLDALRAASLGRIDAVRVRTRKPPAGLAGDAAAPAQPQRLFAGNAIEACRAWPRNVNIAAALSLAGIGGERTEVEIWSDPVLVRNVHEIEIDADSTRLRLRLENLPSATNPRSSALAARSVCVLLRGLVEPMRVGS
jgi:aspartate dehydrogenase